MSNPEVGSATEMAPKTIFVPEGPDVYRVPPEFTALIEGQRRDTDRILTQDEERRLKEATKGGMPLSPFPQAVGFPRAVHAKGKMV